jgi:hypothetical protein
MLYGSNENLLVSCCFLVTAVVKNLTMIIPGCIVALLVILNMHTCVSLFVALPLLLASNTCFRGGFVVKKGGTSGT